MFSTFVVLAASMLLATLGVFLAGGALSRRHWIPPGPSSDRNVASVDDYRRLTLALVLLTVAGSLGSLEASSGAGAIVFIVLLALVWILTSTDLRHELLAPHSVPQQRPLTARLRSIALGAAGVLGIWSFWIADDASLVQRETIPYHEAPVAELAPSALHLSWDAPTAVLRLRNREPLAHAIRGLRLEGDDWRAFVPSVADSHPVAPGAETTIELRADPEQFLAHREGAAAPSRPGYRTYRSGSTSLSFQLGAKRQTVPVTFHGNHPTPPWRPATAIALLLVLAGLALTQPTPGRGPMADTDRPLGPRPLLAISALFAVTSLLVAPVTPPWCTSWPFVPALMAPSTACIEGLGAARIGAWPTPTPPMIAWVLCAWSLVLSSLASRSGVRGGLLRTRVSAVVLLGLWACLRTHTPAFAGGWLLPIAAATLLLAGAIYMWRLATPDVVSRLQRLAMLVVITTEVVRYVPRGLWVRLPHVVSDPAHILLAIIAAHVACWILLDYFLSSIAKRLGFLR